MPNWIRVPLISLGATACLLVFLVGSMALVGSVALADPVALADGALNVQNAPTAPNWKAKCADGKRIEFSECLAKGPVVVAFWATWCKPCLRELPHLNELQKQYPEELTVLAVNIDETRSINKVRPFLKSKRYDLCVPLDTSGNVRRLLQIGSSVPYVIVYDAQGHEVYRHMGYKDGDEKELQLKVQSLLAADNR